MARQMGGVMMSPSDPPRVRNSVTVESPYGLRSFTLVLGDITQAPDPVLAVPTHANELAPVSGQVLTSAVLRYGIAFDSLEPLLTPRSGFGTFRVRNVGRFPGQAVLLVRIPGRESVEAGGRDPLDTYRQALWTLYGSRSPRSNCAAMT